MTILVVFSVVRGMGQELTTESSLLKLQTQISKLNEDLIKMQIHTTNSGRGDGQLIRQILNRLDSLESRQVNFDMQIAKLIETIAKCEDQIPFIRAYVKLDSMRMAESKQKRKQ